MYAVIKSGGKQYKVSPGQKLKLEKLDGDIGSAISLDEVLLVATDGDVKVGQPHVAGASVSAEIINHGRAKKIKVLKFKRRKNYLRTQGHRQWFTEIQVKDIHTA